MTHRFGVLLTPADMFILDETSSWTYAAECAKQYRNDGYHGARVYKYCNGCDEWVRDYSGRACPTCAKTVLTNAHGAVAFDGTVRDPDSILVK